MMGFIERHREIVRAADLPVRDRLAGGEVGDLDLLLVRDIDEDAGPHLLELGTGVFINVPDKKEIQDIDEDAGPHLLELEGFRMRIRRDLADLLAREI